MHDLPDVDHDLPEGDHEDDMHDLPEGDHGGHNLPDPDIGPNLPDPDILEEQFRNRKIRH
jgi:hypothetical protein